MIHCRRTLDGKTKVIDLDASDHYRVGDFAVLSTKGTLQMGRIRQLTETSVTILKSGGYEETILISDISKARAYQDKSDLILEVR